VDENFNQDLYVLQTNTKQAMLTKIRLGDGAMEGVGLLWRVIPCQCKTSNWKSSTSHGEKEIKYFKKNNVHRTLLESWFSSPTFSYSACKFLASKMFVCLRPHGTARRVLVSRRRAHNRVECATLNHDLGLLTTKAAEHGKRRNTARRS